MLSVAVALFVGIGLVMRLVLVLFDVAGRTSFSSPVPGTLEMVSYLLFHIVVYGGYVLAHQRDQHMRMTVVYGVFKGQVGIWKPLIVELLTLVGIAVLIFYAWGRMERSVAI